MCSDVPPFDVPKALFINLFLVLDLSVPPVSLLLLCHSSLPFSILLASYNPYQKDYVVIILSFFFLHLVFASVNPYQKDYAVILQSLFLLFVSSLHPVL